MTSKERAELRAKANGLEAIIQIGKGGISQALIEQVNGALDTRELIKVKVLLETTPEPPKAMAQKLMDATGCEIVQVVGGTLVLYRENPDLGKPKPKKAKVKNRPNSRKSKVVRGKRERSEAKEAFYAKRAASRRGAGRFSRPD